MARDTFILGPRRRLGRRLVRNRYNAESRWVTLGDIWLNLKEEIYCRWHRVPSGATLRWRDGHITSHETRRD
jgi:hypothetical protein